MENKKVKIMTYIEWFDSKDHNYTYNSNQSKRAYASYVSRIKKGYDK